jgi:Phosphotransferase enzyme family
METIEYRCALVRPLSHAVLAFADAGQYHLPRVHIPRAIRPAQELQRAIKAKWGLDIIVLETWVRRADLGACAIAELLTPERVSPFRDVPLEEITSGLFEQECRHLRLLIEGMPRSPFTRLGWIDEAIAWIESVTGRTFRSRNIEQWNSGGGFALLRACSDDGRQYWLKATGAPNAHELGMMGLLCTLCPAFLPKLVAIREDWNAWLTKDAGDPLPDAPSQDELGSATKRMAGLQLLTVGQTDALLAAGAFDQRLPVLRSHIDSVIVYLIEAMARQTSTKAAPLSRNRLLKLGEMLRDACLRLEVLGIPDTLIHNDLNRDNILWDGVNCVFTDWSEAAVGNPFLSCERLCQLNRAHADSVRAFYRDSWLHRLAATSIDQAIAVAPLVAIYAYLDGRGDWIGKTRGTLPQFESYARSLARHMDRAAKDPSLMEVLYQ